MAHVVRIVGGKASYCNRWVRTARLAQEEKAGWALAPKSERGWRGGAPAGACVTGLL